MFIALLVPFLVKLFVQQGLKKLEQENAAIQVERVENAFSFMLNSMENTSMDWSVWDDTYDYIHGTNPGYVDNNLYLDAFSILNINLVIIFDHNNDMLFSKVYDFDENMETSPSSEVLVQLSNLGVEANNSPDFQVSGLMSTEQGVYAIVTSPITRSDGTYQAVGNLVFGRLLNEDQIAYLSEIVGLSFRIKPNDGSIVETDLTVESLNENELRVSQLISDLSGQHDYYLEIDVPADYRSVIDLTLGNLLWVLFAMNLVLIVFISILMNRGLILPLESLSSEILNLSGKSDFKQRLTVSKKQNEITQISTEINSLLNKLDSAHEEIKTLAHFDSLTMLPNRIHFYSALEEEIKNAKANNTQFAVLFVDVDDFKTVNDTYGHVIGDEFIIQMSQRLSQELGTNDVIARTGGDEFLILTSSSSKEKAKDLAIRLSSISKRNFIVKNIERKMTLSIGIAMYPDNGRNAEELITNSDNAMYKAKNLGKNRIYNYNSFEKTEE